MRRLLAIVVLALIGPLQACAPTMRETLHQATAEYTQCAFVQVDCTDEDCSNFNGGPWTATACGTRYRCTHTSGQITCVPLQS